MKLKHIFDQGQQVDIVESVDIADLLAAVGQADIVDQLAAVEQDKQVQNDSSGSNL